MKCIAAVVMIALAVAAVEGSWAPVAYSVPLAYSTPLTNAAAPHATVVQQNWAAPVAYSAYAPAAVSYAAHASVVPTAYAAYQPAPVAIALAQREGRYLAANRGAVHDAPLAGHSVSQQLLNLAPAPGTL